MQIDWITVTAQVINFLILVWLLQRYLYRPVIAAMDRREQDIAMRLGQAREREELAQRERTAFAARNAELDKQREALLEQAREQVELERESMQEQARGDVDAQRRRWQQELEREREDFRKAMRRQVAESAVAVARRALASLADVDLERQSVRVFLRKLDALDPESRAALASGHGVVEVRSALELDDELRAQVAQGVSQALGRERLLSFRHAPDLLLGLELSTEGRCLAWSAADFLDEIDVELDNALRATAGD